MELLQGLNSYATTLPCSSDIGAEPSACDADVTVLLAGAARLPGFHTCVGGGGERQEPAWYGAKGEWSGHLQCWGSFERR